MYFWKNRGKIDFAIDVYPGMYPICMIGAGFLMQIVSQNVTNVKGCYLLN